MSVPVSKVHLPKNECQQIAGIHDATLKEGSGTENCGYTKLDVLAYGSLRLNGFRRHVNRTLNHA